MKHRQNGQALVEFALILPIILMLTLGMLDFGRGLHGYIALAGAVRDGARYGSVFSNPALSSDDVKNRVVSSAAGSLVSLSKDNVTLCMYKQDTPNNCVAYVGNSKGYILRVTATWDFNLLTMIFNNQKITMSATTTMAFD